MSRNSGNIHSKSVVVLGQIPIVCTLCEILTVNVTLNSYCFESAQKVMKIQVEHLQCFYMYNVYFATAHCYALGKKIVCAS